LKRAFVAVLVLAAGACQLIAGIDDRSLAERAAMPDAAPVPDAAPGCRHAFPPDAADAARGPGGGDERVFALELSFARGVDAGFDLDGVCSDGTPAGNGCTQPCDAGIPDDPEGRDNSASTVLGPNSLVGLALLSGGDAGPNDRFRTLLRLTNYDGTDEDSDVTVELYRSHGIAPLSGDAAIHPARDGNDVWTITDDSRVPGVTTARTVSGGIVSDRRLVAYSFPGAVTIAFGGPAFSAVTSAGYIEISLEHAIVSLALPRPGEIVTHGTLTGQWRLDDVFRSIAAIREPETDHYLCGDAGFYPILRSLVCHAADLATAGGRCDALSVAFDVEAVVAKLGDVAQLDAAPAPGCEPEHAEACERPKVCN
jgi:hypothetical protein